MQLDKAIKARKSVQHFSNKTPNWRDIIECIDNARYAPTAGNIFPMRFIVVKDPKIIMKLAEASQQSFIGEAQYVVVVCSDCKLVLNAYEDRAAKFCRQQAGAAIENFLLSIEEKGLASCWVGYFVDYLVREALSIPEDIDVEAIFPIGYEDVRAGKQRKEARRIDMDRILYFDKWKKTRMKDEKLVEGRRIGRKKKEK